MNVRGVLFLLGRVLLALAVALLVPAAVAWSRGGPDFRALIYSAAVAGILGIAIERSFRQGKDFQFGRREAFVLVTTAWVTASIVGALPYVMLKGPAFVVDGLFESASGFTTTGASILTDIEAEPAGLLLWRSMTQWLGGMGIIVLGIAILPKLAVGGMDLLGAEAPGPMQEKLTPRIAQTAKLLWGIYALITAIEIGVLVLLGLSPLDAVNHAFTTMATGGFSTNNVSIAGFDSAAIDMAIVFFMLLAGANFALHFQMFRGRPRLLLNDPEFRIYLGIIVFATLLVGADILVQEKAEGILDALRLASFQVTSVVTTTGFATADFAVWSSFAATLLFLLMFVGGSTGSTGGSVKVVRIIIVAKKVAVDLGRFLRPHAVVPVRLGQRSIPDDVVSAVTSFVILFIMLFLFGGLVLTYLGLDPLTAFTASVACLGNIGPGFGGVGPMENYSWLPVPAKLLLAAMMLIGRLEIYTVLVLVFLRRRRA